LIRLIVTHKITKWCQRVYLFVVLIWYVEGDIEAAWAPWRFFLKFVFLYVHIASLSFSIHSDSFSLS
jgi:hypothetical protein